MPLASRIATDFRDFPGLPILVSGGPHDTAVALGDALSASASGGNMKDIVTFWAPCDRGRLKRDVLMVVGGHPVSKPVCTGSETFGQIRQRFSGRLGIYWARVLNRDAKTTFNLR